MPSRATVRRGPKKPGPNAGRRVLHLEPFSGIAGNMFMAALLDAGLSRKELERDLAGLGVEHRLRVSRVQRGALAARYVRVEVPKHSHGSAKGPSKGRAHGHGHPHGRSWRQIDQLLQKARLEAPIRERARAIFLALGHAEARVHGVALEKVHFHEVGAVDAIVDVTAAASGLHRLGIERVTSDPVALGRGSVETQHGLLPLPAPATLELLAGVPTYAAQVDWETVTPTGAAILKVVVDEFCPWPAMRVEASGYGAGNDRKGALPNVLRATVGREGGLLTDRVVVLESNVDDLVPEHFDYVMERLFGAGALDVSLSHLQMKKNRPGFLIRVIARPSDRLSLARVLFAESSAIGLRSQEWDRVVLEREQRRVDTPYGRIRVKVVHDGDGAREVSAEYDDCRKAARKTGAPLRDVFRAAEQAGRASLEEET